MWDIDYSVIDFTGSTAANSTLCAFLIGTWFGIGIYLALYSQLLFQLGIVLCAMSYFHLWEFTYVALFHSKELTAHSFLLDHSSYFSYMMASCFVEYFLGILIVPSWKNVPILIWPATVLMFCAEFIRTLAMYTAGSNFHHYIQTEKRPDHVLVTTGIYSLIRHPSYFGMFWYLVLMQVVLMNPISLVTFFWKAQEWFAGRIRYEERHLVAMFKDEYVQYAARVPSGIPFVK